MVLMMLLNGIMGYTKANQAVILDGIITMKPSTVKTIMPMRLRMNKMMMPNWSKTRKRTVACMKVE